MSIRERNLTLVRGISRILGLDEEETTWLDVRRNLSDDQVRQVHELYAALWPTDTQLIDLLPRPQCKRSRALYLGMVDARTLATKVTSMLAYVDELILVHPFANANSIREEFSPLHNPAKYRPQTLRSVFMLMVLEPAIRAGRIHLVPDPLDYDAGFRDEIKAITGRLDEEVKLGPIDEALSRTFMRDEMMRAVKRLPPAEIKAYIKQHLLEDLEPLTETDIDSVVESWKQEIEEDPLALLHPLGSSDAGGELHLLKGFARETGLFVATLTGSIVYTDSDTQWARLHDTDGVRHYGQDPTAGDVVRSLDNLPIEVSTSTYYHQVEPFGSGETRELLRRVAIALRAGVVPDTTGEVPKPQRDGSPTYRLQSSVPLNGFQRTDVSRLVLTFGRLEDVVPVQLGLFLDPVLQ
ncbi:hypothetical protein ACWYXK_26630 [Janthinobacterium lividum]